MVAAGVVCIPGSVVSGNVYIVDGVVVDGLPRWRTRGLLRALAGLRLRGQVLTHVHAPIQGTVHSIANEFGLEVSCGHRDLRALQTGSFKGTIPDTWLNKAVEVVAGGPAVPEAKSLREGDVIGGFVVIETPGHSPGHISLWREADRTLIIGDVVTNRSYVLAMRGLREPPRSHTHDPALNRKSARRLAELEPATICFTHGPPLTSGGAFEAYVNRL